ncbi:hypothetical protein [Klebsiella pneumoniae]|uniref:hypothetical protein n=1 Tax=Klebsiella pneumoniae TaxID=573 RepID=UPI0022B60016|nr:hypothetical protein [Klebsiella pneumoniae]
MSGQSAAFEPVVQRHEMAGRRTGAWHEQRSESELTEALPRQRSYDGPSPGRSFHGKQGSHRAFTLKPDIVHRLHGYAV